jgi:hypothetical protein
MNEVWTFACKNSNISALIPVFEHEPQLSQPYTYPQLILSNLYLNIQAKVEEYRKEEKMQNRTQRVQNTKNQNFLELKIIFAIRSTNFDLPVLALLCYLTIISLIT